MVVRPIGWVATIYGSIEATQALRAAEIRRPYQIWGGTHPKGRSFIIIKDHEKEKNSRMVNPMPQKAKKDSQTFRLKRVYESPSKEDGFRILVDRLWPRGITKEQAAIDLWLKEVAPSPELENGLVTRLPNGKSSRRNIGLTSNKTSRASLNLENI
jgi:hypothetical protein